MNYASLKSSYVVKNQKLYVNKKTIFIVFPDTNLDISTELYNSQILLSNCSGLICPNKILNIGKKNFNGKVHYLDMKKKFMVMQDQNSSLNKKLKVISNFISTSSKDENRATKYYFYDATIWSQALLYMQNTLSERASIHIIFSELETLYKQLKGIDSSYDIDLLFLIKDQTGILYNIFKNIKTLVKMDEFKSLKMFDNFALISDCQNAIIPILNSEKGNTEVINNNLVKLDEYIELTSAISSINGENAISPDTEETEINKESPISKIITHLQTSKLIAEPLLMTKDPDIKIGVNYADLRKALKTYQITDPDITANVKSSLDAYINLTGDKPNREHAENIVLKAINYTLSGSDEVPDEYIQKPSLLFNKLKQINTYKVPLNIPDIKNTIIKPNEIIDLKFTTGQHRQKFEFETAIHENIDKLFGSLSSIGSNLPIKVKKIEHTIEDNNADRYINYKITLQNVNGGKKDPYIVELKVPSPVNDKYFKLHGNSYIMSTQQFLKPITKTDKNEVRLISNYGIVRIGLANIKFNPSDIDEILKYINIKYPKLIKEITPIDCTFADDSKIYLVGETLYTSDTKNIVSNLETGKLFNTKTNQEISQGKYEFLYDVILDKVHQANPEETLAKTKKVAPYIWIYLGKIKMPLIIYLWSQKGLLNSLNDYGIEYHIIDKKDIDNTKEAVYIATKNNQYLEIVPKNIKENIVVSILATIKFKKPFENLNDPQEIYQYIAETYGSRSINLITLLTQNFVDPITRELLEFENLPTNLVSLSSITAVNRLLNKKIESLSDLKIYRSRLSEVILNIVYKQIKMSHNYYKSKVDINDENATVYLDPDYVINNLLTEAGVLQQMEPISPVSEVMMSSRVIKSGKGGVPTKRSFRKEHRNIHKSQYGILGACSTPEYADVG
jgi:hypothetical protein